MSKEVYCNECKWFKEYGSYDNELYSSKEECKRSENIKKIYNGTFDSIKAPQKINANKDCEWFEKMKMPEECEHCGARLNFDKNGEVIKERWRSVKTIEIRKFLWFNFVKETEEGEVKYKDVVTHKKTGDYTYLCNTYLCNNFKRLTITGGLLSQDD